MGRKLELSWDKTRKRWKKVYRGKQYYFPFGESKADMIGYEAALEEWHRRKAQINLAAETSKPHRKEYERAIKVRQDIASWCRANGKPEEAQILTGEADGLLRRFNLPNPPGVAPFEADPFCSLIKREIGDSPVNDPTRWHVLEAIWKERLSNLHSQTELDKTLGANIDTYLKLKGAKANIGELSAGYIATLHAHLGRFVGQFGRSFPMEAITSKTLVDFHSELTTLIAEKKIKKTYANHCMVSVRGFARWAWGLDLCNLPRNVDSRELSFDVGPQKIRTFSVEQIKKLLSDATERTRLYILLALNCGMTQADIGDLRHEEFDGKAGRIVRKRSKTKDHENVPTVNYRLWPSTLELLKKYRSADPERVLVNRYGGPLKAETVQDGKFNKRDAISNAFLRLCETAGIDDLTFKHLRKSGASTLRKHREYKSYDWIYLGHSPRSIAERHYSEESQELFDEAIHWLGQQFGQVQES